MSKSNGIVYVKRATPFARELKGSSNRRPLIEWPEEKSGKRKRDPGIPPLERFVVMVVHDCNGDEKCTEEAITKSIVGITTAHKGAGRVFYAYEKTAALARWRVLHTLREARWELERTDLIATPESKNATP